MSEIEVCEECKISWHCYLFEGIHYSQIDTPAGEVEMECPCDCHDKER